MQIGLQRHGAVTVLSPQGPIIGPDADTFRQAATDALLRSQGRFIVDASAIAYVDSKGLEAFLDITEKLATSGGALKLCNVGETLREVLQLTELIAQFENYADVNTAVRSFL